MAHSVFCATFAACLSLLSPLIGIANAQTDDHFRRQPAETGAAVAAFGVDTYPQGPLEIVEVTQIRQAYGRHRFAVTARNKSPEPIASYVIVGLVVLSDGTVKATQPLPAVKNLKAGQSRRQEFDLRVAVLGVPDRLAFAVSEVQHKPVGDPWTITSPSIGSATFPRWTAYSVRDLHS
jgi:hypothetical protein